MAADSAASTVSNVTTTLSSAQPLVTLALLAYNQEHFVRQAIAGALAQTYSPLEIILSDDGSSDRTFDIMREMAAQYRGPHKIRLNRNDPNLGLAAHYNWITEASAGEVIVGAAGDDISLPDRVRDCVETFVQNPGVAMVSFIDDSIDDDGDLIERTEPSKTVQIVDLSGFLRSGPLAQSRLKLSGASRAILRNTYSVFGGLLPNCPAEDSPYVMRSLYLGRAAVCCWPGIYYRTHANQLSGEQSIARMETEHFRSQYAADLAVAARQGILDARTIGSIKRWISDRDLYVGIRKQKIRGEIPSLATALRTLGSKSFSSTEKLGMLKRAVLRKSL